MAKISINCYVPKDPEPGIVRVMWNDGDGNVVIEFDKGKIKRGLGD